MLKCQAISFRNLTCLLPECTTITQCRPSPPLISTHPLHLMVTLGRQFIAYMRLNRPTSINYLQIFCLKCHDDATNVMMMQQMS